MSDVALNQEARKPLSFTGLRDALPPYPYQLEGQRFNLPAVPTSAQSYKPLESQTFSRFGPPYKPSEPTLLSARAYELLEPQACSRAGPSYKPPESPWLSARDYERELQLLITRYGPSYNPLESQTCSRSPSYNPLETFGPYAHYNKALESQTYSRSPSYNPLETFVPSPPPTYEPTSYSWKEIKHSPPFSPTYFEPPLPVSLSLVPQDINAGMFGYLGLHCYNLLNGTQLIFMGLDENFHKQIRLNVMVPTHWGSTVEFLTRVVESETENKGCLSFITTQCRLLTEEQLPECDFDKLAVDDFFKGDMPNSMPEDTSDNLQYYELKESDVEEYTGWLRLYRDLISHTKLRCFPRSPEWGRPFELRKIIVQTREDVESKKKAKAENAIFYISFKTKDGQDCNVIIRRTTDGKPQHMSLEVKCLI